MSYVWIVDMICQLLKVPLRAGSLVYPRYFIFLVLHNTTTEVHLFST